MPIYEFFCPDCNTVFNFFSRRINTEKQPDCPKCGRKKIQRQLSTFATIGKAQENGGPDPLAGIEEAAMEKAFAGLLREAGNINEDDPRQMAGLMRKFSDKTGISLGDRMEEALSRLETGEDPDRIEQEMGDLLDGDDGFTLEEMKKKVLSGPRQPTRDDKLYEL
jgi:putative FmdB family regulatory protein